PRGNFSPRWSARRRASAGSRARSERARSTYSSSDSAGFAPSGEGGTAVRREGTVATRGALVVGGTTRAAGSSAMGRRAKSAGGVGGGAATNDGALAPAGGGPIAPRRIVENFAAP